MYKYSMGLGKSKHFLEDMMVMKCCHACMEFPCYGFSKLFTCTVVTERGTNNFVTACIAALFNLILQSRL